MSNRMFLSIMTHDGESYDLDFRVRDATVQVWRGATCSATIDREDLRAWLAKPQDSFSVDDITFSHDRKVDRSGRVAITMPDITDWTLTPHDLDDLRRTL